MDLIELTIKQAHEGLKNGDFTSVDLTKAYLAKIKKSDLNSFLSITEDLALSQAEKADKKIQAGNEKVIGLLRLHTDYGFENNITRGMAEGIINSFEMVKIKYADGKRMNPSVAQGFLVVQNFVHLAPVEYLGEVIDNGQLLDSGKSLGNLSPESGNVSADE